MMIEKLHFIDSAKSIAKLSEEQLRDESSLLIVLSADASWYLEKLSVPFKTPYDFYDLSELRQINEKLYSDTEVICNYIDHYFRDNLSIIKEKKLLIGQSLFQPIKVALNTIIHRLINIAKIKNKFPNKKFIHYHDTDYLDRKYQYFDNFNDIYRKLIISGDRLKTETIKTENDKNVKSKNSKFITKYDFIFYSNKLKKFYGAKRSKQKNIDFISASDKFILYVLDNTYSIYDLGEYGSSLGTLDLIRINDANTAKYIERYQKKLDDICNNLIDEKNFSALFNYYDLNLLSLFKDIFKNIFYEGAHETLKYFFIAHESLKNNKKSALILPTISYPKQWACAFVAKKRKIPVFVWQHGCYATLDPHSPPKHFDIKNSDYFLSFGEAVKKAFEHEAHIYKTSIIPIGSSKLDKIENTKRNKKLPFSKGKTVLMPLRGIDVSYLGDSYQVYPPDIYWDVTKKLILLFKDYPRIKFILKLYPVNKIMDNPVEKFVRHHEINNVDVVSRPGFSELLPYANLIIIDWPYTTLLEAAQAHKNIICFNKYWTLRKGVHSLLQKRCHMSENLEELNELIDTFNSGHLPLLQDNQFLKEYGIHKSDQKATKRALETIQNITNS